MDTFIKIMVLQLVYSNDGIPRNIPYVYVRSFIDLSGMWDGAESVGPILLHRCWRSAIRLRHLGAEQHRELSKVGHTHTVWGIGVSPSKPVETMVSFDRYMIKAQSGIGESQHVYT